MSSPSFVRREWPLVLDVGSAALFLIFGSSWMADLTNVSWFAFLSVWLLVVILISAFAVVRHAESLAIQLGEPLGTLILTLSVTGVEVMMISAVMFAGHGHAALARDAMFAVVMIVLNGMIGISLLLGGLRHREQTYNLQGANAFLAVIVPVAVLGLVLPNFTQSSPGPTYSPMHATFLIVMSLGLYAVFLVIQNWRHSDYFVAPASGVAGGGSARALHEVSSVRTVRYHAVLLIAYLVPLVILAEQLGKPIQHGIDIWHAPPALGGLIVAALVLSPESVGAARAAMSNDLQRSVNILLGSVLATISLTIPSVLTIGFFTHQKITLGLDTIDMTLLILTLAVSMITFASPRTNVLLGAVHLLLFLAYLMFVFEN